MRGPALDPPGPADAPVLDHAERILATLNTVVGVTYRGDLAMGGDAAHHHLTFPVVRDVGGGIVHSSIAGRLPARRLARRHDRNALTPPPERLTVETGR